MPRYEVTELNRKTHHIQLLAYFLAFFIFGYSLFFIITNPGVGSTVLFIIALSYLIYVIGRLYGESQVRKDFVELTSQGLSYRSTPPFGMGWLPQSKSYTFDEIEKADIIQITPFYDPNNTSMAIQLWTKYGSSYIIGNNLKKEQLIKIGLALQGTVAISSAFRGLLKNTDDMGDQLKDLVNMGKSLWRSFQNKDKEGKQ